MKWIIVGLGNPGGEYSKTRHNAGRIILETLRLAYDLPQWEEKKRFHARITKGDIDGKETLLLAPLTYMNESGKSLVSFVKNKKQAAQLVVLYDDIDLPIGTWKISFNRSSGGHNGVASVATILKTKEFIRMRIGIAPVSSEGRINKPTGEDAVAKFVLGKFRTAEMHILAKVSEEVVIAIPTLMTHGLETAMNSWNKK